MLSALNTTGRTALKTALLLTFVAVAIWYYPAAKSISGFAYLSGWFLLALMLVLAGYNARKKLPFLPLGTSEGWLQFHIYTGLFSAIAFLLHLKWHWPSGTFEQWLAFFYVAVMVTGIFGLAISRTFPQRLTARGGEVIYEQIPFIRRSLQKSAEALALESVGAAGKSTIADFYTRDLAPFFEKRRNVGFHLLESRIPLNRIQAKIEELNRFLNEREREIMARIAALVRQKDGLDYHYALQSSLKLWLFTHIPLTYGLLIFAFFHVVLVSAFSGGAR